MEVTEVLGRKSEAGSERKLRQESATPKQAHNDDCHTRHVLGGRHCPKDLLILHINLSPTLHRSTIPIPTVMRKLRHTEVELLAPNPQLVTDRTRTQAGQYGSRVTVHGFLRSE